ncbi:beta-lactamase [Actinoplanes ianthinogenes]|uniref:Beta-lactamase n=1 Tax=Actinoplanes ianthinogenes TaxID=122358 RepID=A0ABM7M6V3_9ACTN|nr:class A beta-lactamase [Actinoplanes ianthinogenes]BCJ47381.1 beta-lactamase [Actinoplanes ianthinogenes]GGR01429.1 beta-lactamase [Actinoplanes ianthinogenes]
MREQMTRRAVLLGSASAAASLILPGAAAAASNPGQACALDLSALESEHGARIGAFAIDIGSGRTVGHRVGERFPFCSTFKVLAVSDVLRRSRSYDPGLLDRRIRYTAADLVANSPITRQHVDDGMTVAELCAAALDHSDNTAANLILDQLGGPGEVTRYARGLGDSVSRLDRREPGLNLWAPDDPRDTTTPAAMARNLRALTVGRALHPEDRGRLVSWMRANTTGATRIRAGLPTDWVVADKTGTGSTYAAANDIALVEPPTGAPLVLTIYTNRHSADASPDNTLIATIAAALAEALGRR